MNVPLAGEDVKAYFKRQERHWSALAAAALGGVDSEDEDGLDDKAKDRRDKKKNLALKKKAKELAEAAFAEATSAAASS